MVHISRQAVLATCIVWSYQVHWVAALSEQPVSSHQCTGRGLYGTSCLLFNLVLWQKHFYYVTSDQFSFPEVRLGWYEPWHPHGDARLAEHVTIVNPNSLPWEQPEVHDQLEMVHLDQALIYKGLDQRNLYHVMMETGNYIFGTACKLLGACTYATSQHQIFSIEPFDWNQTHGLEAGHDSLRCLSRTLPRWTWDPYWNNKVVNIGSTAVGLGVECEKQSCIWDSSLVMQNEFTSGHRQLMLDCLGIDDRDAQPSQVATNVTIVQRMFAQGRSFLNVLEMHDAIKKTGANVQVVNFEGHTLQEQACLLAYTHLYLLFHGAALALYLFLPRGAAIIEVQHFYSHSPVFPRDILIRTKAKYDMGYHHSILVTPHLEDMVLHRDRITNDTVYKGLTSQEQVALWEQGICPTQQESVTNHCVTKWVFYASFIVEPNALMREYQQALQALPVSPHQVKGRA